MRENRTFKFIIEEDLTCELLGWEESNKSFLDDLKKGLKVMRESGVSMDVVCYMEYDKIRELRGVK